MKNVVLIGFMGTGKSEVGRKVAQTLGWTFVDSDHLIESEARIPIPEIFDRYGEAHFRSLERKVIRKMAGVKNTVIATGGGAVLDAANVKALSKSGMMICLDASPGEILSRVAGSDRPLLQGYNPYERIERLLAIRKRFYNRADRTINTTNKSVDEVSEEILELLQSDREDRIPVDLSGRGYEIRIGSGNLSQLGDEIASLGMRDKIALVTNPRVKKWYGSVAVKSLKKAGFKVKTFEIPDGERYKTLKWVDRLYDALVQDRFERRSCLVALGGGVIGDMTGFAAATYLRGVSFVQVPTTLAAQVDASIGGKTGVNHPLGKNLIGAFHQPRLVLIDTQVLRTLSKRQYVSGLAEVIKYGVIADEKFFSFLESRMDAVLSLEDRSLRHVIKRACEIKAQVVTEDERETDRRRILNYGHTMGHALESATGYRRYLHGEAVAMGMAFAAQLALTLGICDADTVKRQMDLIESTGLSVLLPRLRTADILKSMRLDKKVMGGAIHFVLADRIGHVLMKAVTHTEIQKVIRFQTEGGVR